MVLTGHEIWAHANGDGNGTALNYLHNELERSNIVSRVRGHDMAFMMGNCQVPLTKTCGPIAQTTLLASNQVSNVIKRVHEAAAVDYYDNAKRCRYDNADQLGRTQVNTGADTYGNMKDCSAEQRVDTNGDIEMDVDFDLGHLFTHTELVTEKTQQLQYQQQQQQQQAQQQQHSDAQQQLQESQLLAQIFQGHLHRTNRDVSRCMRSHMI